MSRFAEGTTVTPESSMIEAFRQVFDMPSLAWFAGYFEGEGTVTITRSGRRDYTRPHVSVTSVDERSVRLFDQRWPGKISQRQPPGRARVAYTWSLHAAEPIRRFLSDLDPYWVTDRVREKAALVLADVDERVQGSRDPEYKQRCRDRREAVAVLNRRGRLEEEFLSHIVLPDGSQVGDRVRPELDKAYAGIPTRSLLAIEAAP